MVIRKPCKNTLYLSFSCLYLKNELGDPNFLSQKSNQQAKIKLSAKFKRILWSRFRAILNFQLFKVALNLLQRIFFNFAESFVLACRLHFRNKKWGKMGVTQFVFEIWAAKAKIWGVFAGLSYCHGNVLHHKNDQIFFSNNGCLTLYHNIAVK